MRTLALGLCLLASGLVWAGEPSAESLFAKGRKAEKAGRMAEAYLFYSEAAAMKPDNRAYWQSSQAARARAEAESGKPPAPAGLRVSTISPLSAAVPAPAIPRASALDLLAARAPLPPAELDADDGIRDFDLHGDAMASFQEVAKAFDLECVFDPEYPAGGPLHVQLNAVDYRTALRGLEAATGSFVFPVSAKKFEVVKDTPQKRAEREPEVSVTIPMPQTLTQQEFSSMYLAVQQATAIERVGFDAQTSVVVFRDKLSKVLPATRLLQKMLNERAEILLEVEVLEVSRNDLYSFGVNPQTQFPIAALTTALHNQPPSLTALSGVLGAGGGKTLLGIGVASAAMVASMTQSSARVLLRSSVRSLSGQPASFQSGDSYPVMTSGYFGNSGAASLGGYYPTSTYVDLGLTLKATPVVHDDSEVTLDIDAQYRVLGGGSINGIPVIAQRGLKSQTRLPFGEWAIVAGLMSPQEARSLSGVAGLSRIPFLGPLMSSHVNSEQDSRVLILIRPTLLAPPSGEPVTVFVGTYSKPVSPL